MLTFVFKYRKALKSSMKITILSCSKKKHPLSEGGTIEAKDLYQGQIFRKSYIYANKFLKPDRIYILSAKYGLLKPSDNNGKIPYN